MIHTMTETGSVETCRHGRTVNQFCRECAPTGDERVAQREALTKRAQWIRDNVATIWAGMLAAPEPDWDRNDAIIQAGALWDELVRQGLADDVDDWQDSDAPPVAGIPSDGR